MRLTCILILAFVLGTSAAGFSQAGKLNLSLKNGTLVEALEQIEDQSEYYFYYNNDEVRNVTNISIKADNGKIEDVLNELLSGTGLTYKVMDRFIVVKKGEDPVNVQQGPQQKDVTGKVTDSSGSPMPGVTVLVKGTTNGRITDTDGNYSLTNVPSDGMLVFSFVGMKSQEIAVVWKSQINVTMVEETIGIEEVVAVGYGTMKKADITTAVSTITSNEIANRPVLSLTEAMAGQVAGVEIQQGGGQPGGTNMRVRIRGTNSISSSSDPLYVVDGVPMSNALSFVSNNDIENITVLKDVSATAIYGSRGSSGVVMITTKRAKIGAPSISVNSSVGIQQIANKIPMMGKADYIQLIIDSKNNSWVDKNPAVNKATDSNATRQAGGAAGNLNYIIPDGQSNPWGTFKYNILDPNDVAKMADTDWQDEIHRNAIVSQQEINITGGTNNTRYVVSGNYGKQDGIVINSNYERFNTRAYVETKVRENLTVGLQLMGNYGSGRLQAQGRNEKGGGWGINLGALSMAPVFPVKNSDGAYADMKRNPEILGSGSPGFNPVEMANSRYRYKKNYGWSANGFAEWEIIPNLTYKFTLDGQFGNSEESFFEPSGVNDYGETTTGTKSNNSQANTRTYLMENLLNYNITLAKKNNIAIMGGYTVENAFFGSIYAAAANAPTNYVQLVTGTPVSATTGSSEYALISYLGRFSYNYDNRYLFTSTVRWDGSSRFSTGNKWGFFPSVSAGWNISEEAFMENVKQVINLKIRGGWGISGNNAIGNFEWQGNMGSTWYPLGSPQTSLYGVVPGSKPENDDLTWEKTQEYNIGLDFGLLKNRIFLSGDYYIRRSYDLLLQVPTPVISGQTQSLVNRGKMRNSGVEFMLSTKNMVRDFKWSTDFNFSHNKNEVLALGPDDTPILVNASSSGPYFKTMIGYPLSTFWGYQVEGIFKDDADLANHIQKNPGLDRPGQMYYKDVNPDGVIDANDMTNIGNNYPIFIAGMTNHFSYKNFSLDLQLTGSYGGQTCSIFFREFVKGTPGSRGAPKWLLDRWKSPTDPGNGIVPAVVTVTRGIDNNGSSYWVQDNSYLRIRNLSLAYDFDSKLLKNINLSRLKVYVMANNLYTFTNYFGYDPEAETSFFGTDAGSTGRGADYLAYPTARTFTLGVNLTF